MDITPLIPEGQKVIQRYGAGKFCINDIEYDTPLILFSAQVIAWQGNQDVDYKQAIEILSHHGDAVEVVLFGVGKEVQSLLPEKAKRSLKDMGMACDIMNTGAACRTYNVLLAEGRKVAAVLLPVE